MRTVEIHVEDRYVWLPLCQCGRYLASDRGRPRGVHAVVERHFDELDEHRAIEYEKHSGRAARWPVRRSGSSDVRGTLHRQSSENYRSTHRWTPCPRLHGQLRVRREPPCGSAETGDWKERAARPRLSHDVAIGGA